MKAQRDKKGKWYIQYRYTNYCGKVCKTTKRGFISKREAEQWLIELRMRQKRDMNMMFESFIEIYMNDMRCRLRENTMIQKGYMIRDKIIPFFGKKKICDIKPIDVREWEREMMKNQFSQTYLRTIYNQLNAIFNYAVMYYNLSANPCHKAGRIGKNKADEMKFWTTDEYLRFSDAVVEKPMYYHAFQMLYWCGIREGEMLALTPADFNFETGKVSITKSFQSLRGREVITPPKTPKSIRVIKMSSFLCKEMKDYIRHIYGIRPNDRIFTLCKSGLHREMIRGCNEAGVKKIRVHDLRHSHVSLLANMHFTMNAIAERMGHETIEITQHYAHLFPSVQDEMANKLEKWHQEKEMKERESFWDSITQSEKEEEK